MRYKAINLFSIPVAKISNSIDESYRSTLYNYLDLIWNDNTINHLTCNWALEYSEAGAVNAKSTARLNDYSLHGEDLLKPLVKIIEKYAKEYWNDLGFKETQYPRVTDMWANMHGKKGVTGLHNHGGSLLSGAIYISVPLNSGKIKFLNPLELIWFQAPHQIDFDFRYEEEKQTLNRKTLLDYFYEQNIANSDLLIWPSWLKHCTEVNNSNKKRVVISFNMNMIL